MSKRRIKLVVFDLDGTLVDSIEELLAATNYVRTAYSLPPFTELDVRTMLGNGGKRLIEQALPEAGKDELKRAMTMYLEFSETHLLESTRIFPSVMETLAVLEKAGVRMAIISNKHSKLSRKLLAGLGMDTYFSAILGPDSLPRFKPSPDPVFKLLEEFSTTADECLLVGDSISDISTGKCAGVLTVGCLYGYGNTCELSDADYHIESITELLKLPLFV
jgi:phosphoglycolate phosphatase